MFGVEEGGELARPGMLEQAHGGTLFLDEIADMPMSTQAKILRVLTDQSFVRVGGQRTVKVDMRVVSSTALDLAEEIAGGRFREDLYYRLNVGLSTCGAVRAPRGHSGTGDSFRGALRPTACCPPLSR